MVKKKSQSSTKPTKKVVSAKKPEVMKTEISSVDVKEKVSQGWLLIHSQIDIIAVNKEATEESLKNHITRFETDMQRGAIIVKKSFSSIEKVENPPKDIKNAFSQYVELEILFKDYASIFYFVMNYGPISLSIIEPKLITIGQGEAEYIANLVATYIHQFAASGVGGLVISRKQ